MSPHHDRPHPMRSLLILSFGRARVLARADDAHPRARRADAPARHRRERDRLGADRLPARRRRRDADRRPPRRHVRQAPAARHLAAACSALGSTVAALGNSLELVVAGRVLQGFGGGIFPLCFGIIRDEFPRERVAGSIGLISAIFGIGGGAGLIGGGLIADHLSYHWIFWLGTITAALAALATQVVGARVARAHARPRSTCRGAALLARRPRAAADRDLARERLGLGRAADARPDRRRPRRARDLGRGRAPHRRSRSPTSPRCWSRPC